MSDEAMILRREIRKPARYRPEPNPKLAEAFVPPVARPAFAPPYVAYNPDLPPAAFPSLSAPRPGGSRTDEAKDRPVSASGALTEAGRRWVERHDAAYGRWVEETANESELRDGGERGEEEPSEELIAARYTQAVRFDGSMARLGKMVQRTDEQWVEGEMKASDGEEEGPVVGTPERQLRALLTPVQRRRPVWNDLSPNHRTAIVTALLQAHALPTVYAILCLSDAQQREDQVHRGRRDERERLEDEKIAALQTELTEVLLTSDETQWERFPQSRFGALVEKHLYTDLRKADDEGVSTKGELIAARTFLLARGLDPRMLGTWAEPGAYVRERPRVEPMRSSRTATSAETDTPVPPRPLVAAASPQARAEATATRGQDPPSNIGTAASSAGKRFSGATPKPKRGRPVKRTLSLPRPALQAPEHQQQTQPAQSQARLSKRARKSYTPRVKRAMTTAGAE